MIANEPRADALAPSDPVGQVLAVRGSEAMIGLPAPARSATNRATVASFLAIQAGPHQLVATITEVTSRTPSAGEDPEYRAVARAELVGEIQRGETGARRFTRGVRHHPAIGDEARLIGAAELNTIHSPGGATAIPIGHLSHDHAVPALANAESLVSKHFAVLGSTGVGKSSGVAIILRALLGANLPLRTLLLDVHNEYSACFPADANIIDAGDFKLPFWIFNFDELTDAIYGGRPAPADETEILAELIPIAKTTYLNYKASNDKSTLKRRDPRQSGFTVDTPVPYLLHDLMSLIDERMGKLENRSSRMAHHRLLSRIEMLKNNPRYAFMFDNATVGGDTMGGLLGQLFRLTDDAARISILKLASIPTEVVDTVVCVVLRLAFEFGLWSNGAKPLLCLCEEAHRFASADHAIGFAPTRRAISRIAKEGRKYGVYLGLVSQRPAELDPTVISQCSTIFAMRMPDGVDHQLLRSAMPDGAATLVDLLPTLGTAEAIGLGEGFSLPVRFSFTQLPPAVTPKSEACHHEVEEGIDGDFMRDTLERWRKATMSSAQRQDEPAGERVEAGRAAAENAPRGANMSAIERMRDQILRR